MTEEVEIHIVSHTHWDREWFATFQVYRFGLVRLMDKLLHLLETKADYRSFTLDGQAVLLEDYLEIRPEAADRLRRLVQEGRLFIGPWYVLADEFLVSGEALVRNLLLGRQVASAFGPVLPVGYCPDAFGHIAQLPQILCGFGIESFLFGRGLGDEGETLGAEFWWEAPDGSRVLAIHQVGGYYNASNLGHRWEWVCRNPTEPPQPELALERIHKLLARMAPYARTRYRLFNNGCDHVEPQADLPALLAHANQQLSGARILHSDYATYSQRIRESGAELGTYRGELRRARYEPLLNGTLSARMLLKLENHRVQTLLERWAEPFAAFAYRLGETYPRGFLRQAWKLLLQNHPHDSICGCSIDPVHREMAARFAQAGQIAETILTESLASIARRVDTRGPEGAIPLLIFNPSPYPRTDVVSAVVDLPLAQGSPPQAFILKNGQGESMPLAIVSRKRVTLFRDREVVQSSQPPTHERLTLRFVAQKALGLGYTTLFLCPAHPAVGPAPGTSEDRPQPSVAPLVAEERAIENEFFRVQFEADRTLSLLCKETGHLFQKLLVFEDVADRGDAYTFEALLDDRRLLSTDRQPTLNIQRQGDAQVDLRMAWAWELPASLTADRKARTVERVACPLAATVSLYAGVRRVDLRIEVENLARDHRLRVLFPTGIQAGEVTAGGHFGVIRRPVGQPSGQGWAEPPSPISHQAGFVDVGDGQLGLAVFSRGLPEYEAVPEPEGLTLAMTLLRCVGWVSRDDLTNRPRHTGPGLPVPEAQCLGQYTFHLALFSHSAAWATAGVHRQSRDFEAPLRCFATRQHPGALPSSLSFARLKGTDLALSALKGAEAGEGLVLRIYNPTDHSTQGALYLFPAAERVVRVNLAEEEQGLEFRQEADGEVRLSLQGGEICTLGVELENPFELMGNPSEAPKRS